MEQTIVIALVVIAALYMVGKSLRDARRFNQNGPTDCGCGRGGNCRRQKPDRNPTQ